MNLSCFFVVARYQSGGNNPGSYRSNVLRGKFNETLCRRLESFVDSVAEQMVEFQKPEVEARSMGKIGLSEAVVSKVSRESELHN